MIGGIMQSILWHMAVLMLILTYAAAIGLLLIGQRYITLKKKRFEWVILLCAAVAGILTCFILSAVNPGILRSSAKGYVSRQAIYKEADDSGEPLGYQIVSGVTYSENEKTIHKIYGIGKFILKTEDGFTYCDISVKNGKAAIQGAGETYAPQLERSMREATGKDAWNSFNGKTESYSELKKSSEQTVYSDDTVFWNSESGWFIFLICILPSVLLLFDYIWILRKRRIKRNFMKTRLQDLE